MNIRTADGIPVRVFRTPHTSAFPAPLPDIQIPEDRKKREMPDSSPLSQAQAHGMTQSRAKE